MTFEIRQDLGEVTMNGLFGGDPDTHRVYLPGLPHFFVDGTEVSEAEFMRLWAIERPDVTAASS